jgi:peptidoglycan/xylan/chitin deacetylase (PgdA/CDA1 family)
MPALLDTLRALGVPATFFTTGDVAARYPSIVKRVVEDGHELGSHGMSHASFDDLDPSAAAAEIGNSATILRRIAPVVSFRAPYLRFPARYLPILSENGFALDSSAARYKHPRRRSVTRSQGLTIVPASVTSSVLRLPGVVRDPLLDSLPDPVVLFVHPWEFVDLRRERLRLDCRFRTGDTALACLRDVIARFASRSCHFVRMHELIAS